MLTNKDFSNDPFKIIDVYWISATGRNHDVDVPRILYLNVPRIYIDYSFTEGTVLLAVNWQLL